VHRSLLIERLARGDPCPIVSVVAPPGYGKTTLLSQWAERPGLGTLAVQAQTLKAQLAKQRGSITPGASSLTAAELRLLPLLSTYLPLREIAAELFLSPHTIKTQTGSIYRKLGASTRSQAVTRARQLGLLDG
jgi:LuxR family maltose regulon positive regulatory protein